VASIKDADDVDDDIEGTARGMRRPTFGSGASLVTVVGALLDVPVPLQTSHGLRG
jgi:hypothetical protein